jgi:hypothetical protein
VSDIVGVCRSQRESIRNAYTVEDRMYGKIMADSQVANEKSGPEGILSESRVSGKCRTFA